MTLTEIIKRYVADWPNESNRKLASLILEQEDSVEVKHRTLRRKISEYKSAVTNPQHRMHHKTVHSAKDGNQELVYRGPQSICSLEDAIEFFDVDTTQWEVQSWTANSWDTGESTNYQVKLKLVPRQMLHNTTTEVLLESYRKAIQSFQPRQVSGSGTGVLVLADFHVGAKVEGLQLTDDFGYDVIVSRLDQAARQVNRLQYEAVEVVMLGDFIESFTGLNHPNSWQELEYGGYGSNVVILAYKILRDFMDKIHNLSAISIVSGNHDRTSIKSNLDPKGGVAQLLAFMLEQSNPMLSVEWNPVILSKQIDGIQYIMSHNHHGIAKNDMTKIFWEHGAQGSYNILLGGHWHSRRSKKAYRTADMIHWDQANYRAISVAPLFTGNFYSESNGWTSSSGITIIENNGAGKPNVYDYTLI
jgi:predicted phosphodiesterase